MVIGLDEFERLVREKAAWYEYHYYLFFQIRDWLKAKQGVSDESQIGTEAYFEYQKRIKAEQDADWEEAGRRLWRRRIPFPAGEQRQAEAYLVYKERMDNLKEHFEKTARFDIGREYHVQIAA
jgi:hypothetical protein